MLQLHTFVVHITVWKNEFLVVGVIVQQSVGRVDVEAHLEPKKYKNFGHMKDSKSSKIGTKAQKFINKKNLHINFNYQYLKSKYIFRLF